MVHGRIKDYGEYVWNTCLLYGMKITLSSPINLIMGNVDLFKRNALECLHTT